MKVIIRPPASVIAAKKWEIRRRYQRQAGPVTKRGRSMAAIRLSELTRWLNDEHGTGYLPESDRSVHLVRIMAHHMGALPETPRRITSWLQERAPWITGAERERLISEVVSCPLKWSADKLAWHLGLDYAARQSLKITTIGATDCNREQRAAIRQKRRAENAKAKRAATRQAKAVTSI